MKKTFALLLLTTVMTSLSAQDKLQKGDLIYGTVSDSDGPVAGMIVVERNANNRIVAQTTTDVNGNFSFRLVNPEHELCISQSIQKSYKDFNSIVLPITRQKFEIQLKKHSGIDESLMGRVAGIDIIFGPNPQHQDIYIPFSNQIHYGSVEELFNNWFLEF